MELIGKFLMTSFAFFIASMLLFFTIQDQVEQWVANIIGGICIISIISIFVEILILIWST